MFRVVFQATFMVEGQRLQTTLASANLSTWYQAEALSNTICANCSPLITGSAIYMKVDGIGWVLCNTDPDA
jgi:hypothetical protein